MKIFKLLLLFIFITAAASAQNFLEPTESFSVKKDAYITLKDGKEVTGQFRKTKRKKGLFLTITIKDGKGDKVTYEADQIKHMYLPASGWDKFAKAYNNIYDATDWNDDSSLNQEYLKDGYAYFESVTTKIKKKTRVTLLQVLNPAYCQKVRIYNNPWASETASLGIGGFKVAGGDTKSFYVKAISQDKAFLLKKKNYKDEFKNFYGDCKSFMKKYKDMKWSEIEEHVFEHAKACNKA
ncbi:MAG: hypothetical protein ACI8P3_003874 [Saprospiraceae bacterium]|jgi:hypothetical protein